MIGRIRYPMNAMKLYIMMKKMQLQKESRIQRKTNSFCKKRCDNAVTKEEISVKGIIFKKQMRKISIWGILFQCIMRARLSYIHKTIMTIIINNYAHEY